MQLSVPQKHLGPRSFFVCALSINLLLILSIDMYVPALPSMQRAFDVSAAYLNLTCLLYTSPLRHRPGEPRRRGHRPLARPPELPPARSGAAVGAGKAQKLENGCRPYTGRT